MIFSFRKMLLFYLLKYYVKVFFSTLFNDILDMTEVRILQLAIAVCVCDDYKYTRKATTDAML